MTILVVNILFVLLNLSLWVNLFTATEIGESACKYSGDTDPGNKLCHKDRVKLHKLPEECTSYFFDGVTCKPDLEIVPSYSDTDLEILSSLIENKPKNVFLFYQRGRLEKWFIDEDPTAEAQKIHDFVDKYNVGGLILSDIDYNFLPEDIDFYQRLSAYVKAIKTKLPDLKIGFYLNAKVMIRFGNDYDWFDFSKMNDVLDFYLIEFASYNLCTDELLHDGITPLVSTNPDIKTLTMFAAVLNGSTIAKDKVYFELLINPQPKYGEEGNTFKTCEVSYNEYCENDYDKTWCVDNQDTFYEKGQFAKQHAKGFVARYIDLVDRDLKCECNEDKYITFHMLLNGFKGTEKVTCERLKG